MVWDDVENRYAVINAIGQSELESDVVVLSLANAGVLIGDVQTALPVDVGARSGSAEICPLTDNVALSLLDSPETGNDTLPLSVARQTGHDMLNAAGVILASTSNNSVELVSYTRRNMLPKFAIAYRSMRKLIAMMELGRIQDEATLARATIVGTVSTYNPYRDGKQEGDPETASGEPYDPGAWTAAIQTDLRSQFGGIGYGRLYQPAYALVESADKQVIVKVNDVGPLRPGRVLDLNERAMRYFDPFLTRGLLADVKITPLPGEDWTPGPIGGAYLIDFAAAEWRAASGQFGPIDRSKWQSETASVPLRPPPAPIVEKDARAEAKPSAGG
jgi:rare lipoprotein A